jgi:uncharacterized protein with NRDE domain
MCLLLAAWKLHPRHDLVLAANRDEQHDRATGELDHWTDFPGVVGGRDQVAGGTWLALHRDGRFAAVTNYRDSQTAPTGGASRGELVSRYLSWPGSTSGFLRGLSRDAGDYAGFSLLLGDASEFWYASNRAPLFARPLPPGIYGLSNDLLDTRWHKVEVGIAAMHAHIDSGGEDAEPLFEALARQDSPPSTLPWPASSGPFIAHGRFGTRASTLLRREPGGAAQLEERRFGPLGKPAGVTRLCVPLTAGVGSAAR